MKKIIYGMLVVMVTGTSLVSAHGGAAAAGVGGLFGGMLIGSAIAANNQPRSTTTIVQVPAAPPTYRNNTPPYNPVYDTRRDEGRPVVKEYVVVDQHGRVLERHQEPYEYNDYTDNDEE